MGRKTNWAFGIAGVVVVVGVAVGAIILKPLLTVGSAYAAKIVCSNYFLAGRDPEDVLAIDVQAPGHPLLKIMRIGVSEDTQMVHASPFGLGWAGGKSIHRKGFGCTNLPAGLDAPAEILTEPEITPIADSAAQWPTGNADLVNTNVSLDGLVEDAMKEPGTRAIVVVKDGRLVAEAYADGFSKETPLLGWSMAKTVTAMLAGVAEGEGLTDTEESGLVDHWAIDDRQSITLENLLHMESGLEFNESYGSVTDVTSMLYTEADMAGFTSLKLQREKPATIFNYSSGTTNIISAHLRQRFGEQDYHSAFQAHIFNPLGITSAVFETDAFGTIAGSSYLYASARDWAKLGLLLAQDGVWNGNRILPDGWVDYMRQPSPASEGRFGAHLWLVGPKRDKGFELPDDAVWMRGHDGQSVAIVPSKGLVVVRMGLTPSKSPFRPQKLVQALVDHY